MMKKKERKKKNVFILPHRLESLKPMCIPQSNMTQKASSSVTSTQERPTSCPAPRQRTLIPGEEVIFFSFLSGGVEVDEFFRLAVGDDRMMRCRASPLSSLSLSLSLCLSLLASLF